MSTNASTISQERQRKGHQKDGRTTARQLQQRFGIITEVHETLPMIKASFDDGSSAAGGDWIGVGHSVLDIVHRFGTLRKGLKVLITYSGEVETNVLATVVGLEDEKLGNELTHPNTFDSSFPWELGTPGGAV